MKRMCAAALALALATACKSEEGKTELPAAAAAPAPISVATHQVQKRPVSLPIAATGTAEPVREADLAASVSARITAVLVEEGQKVVARQPLVRLDTAQARLGAAQAQASARAAQAQAEQLAADHERLAPLAARGTVPQSRVDQLASQRDAAQAQASAALSAAHAAQRVVADSTVRAPFAGTVTRVPVEVGEIASMMPGSPLVRLVDLSELEVKVPVVERDLARLSVGDPARATFPSLGITVDATISRVALELDAQTRTAEVVARVPNPDETLRAGLFAELQIQPSKARDAIVVPSTAVGRAGGEAYVMVVEDGVALRRQVEVAAVDDARVEIVAGLEGGEVIVAKDVGRVAGGAAVTVTDDASAAEAKRAPAPDEENATEVVQ